MIKRLRIFMRAASPRIVRNITRIMRHNNPKVFGDLAICIVGNICLYLRGNCGWSMKLRVSWRSLIKMMEVNSGFNKCEIADVNKKKIGAGESNGTWRSR